MAKRFLYFISTVYLLYISFISPIHAVFEETTSSAPQPVFVPHEFIVKYKDGQNPNDLDKKIQVRMERGTKVFGLLRNVGEDLVTRLRGKETPEEAVETLKNLEAKAKVVEKEYVFALKMQEKILGASTDKEEFPFDDYFLLKTSPQTSVSSAIKEFHKDSRIEFAEPNYIMKLMEAPNDPYYQDGSMWGLEKIQMEEAWDINKGSKSITVAVVDSGVDYNHADFQGGNVEVVKGKNFAGCGLPADNPMDQNGHGTHVAGTIGAATNNNLDVAGINWNVKILAIKCGCASRDIYNAPQGVVYAADHGAKVINMSWGGSGYSTLRSAIEYARGKGIVLVGAAGNENLSTVIYPARYDEVIAVAASTPGDKRASFSHYGEDVDVAAPGVDILSLYPNNRRARMDGTSMASPHVAGLAALILAQNPSLGPDEVKSKIVDYADPIDTDRQIGPRINAYRSLNGTEPTPTPTGSPTPTPTPSRSPSPTPPPGDVASITLTVRLQGINSKKKDRDMRVTIDFLVYHPRFYSDEAGNFTGTIDLNIASGSYTIAVREPHHSTKEFSVDLAAGENTIVKVSAGDELRAGDIDGDDDIDEDDRQALLEAYSPFAVIDAVEDLDEDGYVKSLDYSLLLTNFEGSAPTCGNDNVEGSEECDGTDDDACPGECQDDCTCPSNEEPVCGNNNVEGTEECDGTDDDVCPDECQDDCTCPSDDDDGDDDDDDDEWAEWEGEVTVDDVEEVEPIVFVAACLAEDNEQDCVYDYVYRKPDEEDGGYSFEGRVGYYYKTFTLATDCEEETGDGRFPYKPCSEHIDDYYNIDGPVWVTPPESEVDFELKIECVSSERVEPGYIDDHECGESTDPFAVCEGGKDYFCHAINTGDDWVWSWHKRVPHEPFTLGPCYSDVPGCALYKYASHGWGEGCCNPENNEWLPDSDCEGKTCGSGKTCDGAGVCVEE